MKRAKRCDAPRAESNASRVAPRGAAPSGGARRRSRPQRARRRAEHLLRPAQVRLPARDPQRAGLRRGCGDAAAARELAEPQGRGGVPHQARGHAARLQFQDPRRLQQDRVARRRRAREGRRRLFRGEPRAGRRHELQLPEGAGDDRHAAGHAAHQGRRRRPARRRLRAGAAARRLVRRRVRGGDAPGGGGGPHAHPPLRRPSSHRRPGERRRGDPAPDERETVGRDLLLLRGRRSVSGRRGLRQAGAAGRARLRRRGRRRRGHDGVAGRGRAGRPGPRRIVRGRRRGQGRGDGDAPVGGALRRRHGHGGQRRNLRGDQAGLRGHAVRARARGRAGARGPPEARRVFRRGRRHLRGRRVGREHGLRPAALRVGARGPVGGPARVHDAGGARRVPEVLRFDLPLQRHGVLLPLPPRRRAGGRHRRVPAADGPVHGPPRGARLRAARHHGRRARQHAPAPPQRRALGVRRRRAHLPLRVPRGAGRAQELPRAL